MLKRETKSEQRLFTNKFINRLLINKKIDNLNMAMSNKKLTN